MTQLIDQMALFRLNHEENVPYIGDTAARRPAAVVQEGRLPLGLSLALLLVLSAVLWTGIAFLSGFVWHYILHMG